MSIVYERYRMESKVPSPVINLNPRSEDILVGNVFGLLMVLHPRIWIEKLLKFVYRNRVFPPLHYDRFIIEFWKKLYPPPPILRHGMGVSEIDVFIEIPPLIIMIECKYLAKIRYTGDDKTDDQIQRYQNLSAYHFYSDHCKNVYLLLISNDENQGAFITEHRDLGKIKTHIHQIRPHVNYDKISVNLAQNLGWLLWTDLIEIMEGISTETLGYSEKKIIEELIGYIKYKFTPTHPT